MSAYYEQLPLAVQLRDDATFDNFFIADNGLLLEQLKKQCKGGEPYLYIYGSQGCGRSHLLQAACHLAELEQLSALYLPLNELVEFPPAALFESIENLDLICLDELDTVLGQPHWEEALFHLFNRLKSSGTALLIAANHSVRALPVTLADLHSRLSWGAIYQVQSLNDEQRQQALQFRAAKRGVELTDDVVFYIYQRCQRDTRALFNVLDLLDKASLKQQRKLTIPFVKDVLGW